MAYICGPSGVFEYEEVTYFNGPNGPNMIDIIFEVTGGIITNVSKNLSKEACSSVTVKWLCSGEGEISGSKFVLTSNQGDVGEIHFNSKNVTIFSNNYFYNSSPIYPPPFTSIPNKTWFSHNITIENSNVSTGSSVTMIAENSITILPNTTISYNFTASIQDLLECSSGRIANPDSSNGRNINTTISGNNQQTTTHNPQLETKNQKPKTVSEFRTKNSELKLYPNPNNGTMQMDYRLQENETGELIIYDITGRRVKRILLANQNNTLQIQDSELKDGMYLYHVVVNGEIKVSEKLVVIR